MLTSLKTAESVTILLIRNPQPYDFGGGERMPVHLATELSKYGHHVTIVSRSSKVLDYAAAHGVNTVRGWWWSRQNWTGARILLTPIYFAWQLILICWYLQLILKTKADVLHPQGRDDFIAATIAGKLLGKRIVWSDHADLKYIYENYSTWYKNPISKAVYATSNWARAVILTSQGDVASIKKSLDKNNLPQQYCVIYNGVSDQAVVPVKRSKDDAKAYIFCATSRLVTAKGIGELIEAFGKLHATQPDTRLWLVGDGPEAEHFKKQAAPYSGITFFGHMEAPLPLVAACDVFTHPSYLEGFSVSLIEAAMLAKPIIACNVGGNPELVHDQETGLLIKERDPDDLYRAMKLLYDNRQLAKKLGTQARARYERELQFENIVKEHYLPLYET